MLTPSRWVAFLVALGLVLAACGGSGDAASDGGDGANAGDAPSTITLEVVDGALVGGARTESASLGDEITIELVGNSDDSVHVHGYDLYIEPVDGAGSLSFEALIPGIFELELEEAGTSLIRLKVS